MGMRAVWQGRTLAESDETVRLEGNHYFPFDSLNMEYFIKSDHHSTCFWKGEADYFDLEVEGERNPAAAWTYREPLRAAANIRGYVAFWKGVQVEEVP